MLWRNTDEKTIRSWSALDLVAQVEHDFGRSASRCFSKSHSLAQGSYGFTNDQQKNVFEHIAVLCNEIMDASYRCTLWISTQEGQQIKMRRDIPDADSVVLWFPEKLVTHISHTLGLAISELHDPVRSLSSGYYNFSNTNQRVMIEKLQRDTSEVAMIFEVMQIWLSSHASN